MATGTVKWFSNQKGYGFIVSDKDAEDVFVHFSSMDGYRTLKPGQQVEFDITQGPKGLHAANLRRSEMEDGEMPETAEAGAPAAVEVEAGDIQAE